MLGLKVCFFGQKRDSLVLLLKPHHTYCEPYAYFYLEERLLATATFVPGDDGAVRLVGALLSDYEMGYDLTVWARATPMSKGTLFIPEGSTLRTRDDLVSVTAASMQDCFAGDDSGGLFAFSANTGEFREIDRDRTSKIRALKIVDFISHQR